MITLDKETHTYRNEKGVILPSVTQILKAEGFIDDAWFTEYARTRGEMVHLATKMYDDGTLDESALDPVIVPYLEGYKRFLKESGFEVHFAEETVYSPSCQFAGTLDRRGLLNGRKTLIDIKTGTVLPWVALQTTAYDSCLLDRHDRFGLQLTDDGKHKLIPFKDRYDVEVFLSAFACFNWKKNKGIK